jgi:hypothetical protein
VVPVSSAIRLSRGKDGVVTSLSQRETVIDSTPSSSASCFWVRPALRLAVRSRPPTPPLSWVPKLFCSYQSERPDEARMFDVLSTIAEAYAFPAALAALVALGEEERPAAARQLVAENPAPDLHASGPTLTSIFPMFSPRRSPRNAFGAFSIPSTIVSRYWRRPSRTQSDACCTNSPNRSKWSLMM